MPSRGATAFEHIDSHFHEHVEALQEYLRIKSISLSDTHNYEVDACAEYLRQQIEDLGAEDARLVRFKDGYPVVYGRLASKNPNAKTMIFYSLYDVMPTDEPDWKCDPFEGRILDAEVIGLPASYGKCIVARGARNQKGPTMGFIKGVEAMLKTDGDVPVNIIFVIEGEEEVASVHLGEFRDRYLDVLKKADGVWYGNPAQDEKGVHHVYCGFKGLVSIELVVEGGDWGGPVERSLFPADDNWIDAPAWRLIWALASLKSPDGKVRVEGFYDDIRPPLRSEAAMVERIESNFDEEGEKKRLGIKRFKNGRPGVEYVKEYCLGPVFNIDGYMSGYTGPKVKTMFPRVATAKIDIRLVPNMNPEDILSKLRKHLDSHGFAEVEIRTLGYYKWSRTPESENIVRCAVQAAERHGVKSICWPSYWACVPISVFSEPPLNLPGVSAGLGRMGRPHEANEFITVEGLRDYEKYTVTFLNEFARS